MASKPQQFAANNRQIAGVLGLKPTAKQLATIGEWRSRKDFPKKQAQGYRVAELLRWYSHELEKKTGEETRIPRINANSKPEKLAKIREISVKDSQPPLSPQGDPAEGELFSKQDQYKNRLEFNLDIYLNPSRHQKPDGTLVRLTLDEKRELAAAGMIPKLGAESSPQGASRTGDYPDTVSSMDAIGALIRQRFGDRMPYECKRQQIQKWKGLEGVTRRTGLVPFPNADDRGDYDVQECLDWVERWIIPDLSKPTGELLSGLSARDEMEQIELREARRREQFSLGNLVSFLDVRGFIQATPLRLANALNRIEEPAGFQKLVVDDLAALLEQVEGSNRLMVDSGASASVPSTINAQLSTLLAAFGEMLSRRCREFNDQLKAEAEEGRRKATADLDKLREEQMAAENSDS